jgi:serine-type D-Ala-D-Ala carboxypeptidase (penicillin-binding protein 5/6)
VRARALAIVGLLALAGCAGDGAKPRQAGSVPAPAPRPAGVDPAPALRPLQGVNGPPTVTPGDRPLVLRGAQAGEQVRDSFTRLPAAGVLFDVDTGEVLWARLPGRVLPIASLTKMMTALLVVERLPDDAKAMITPEVLRYRGSGVGVLPRNKRVKVETLLHGLLLASGNDAAIALALRVSGSQRAFVARMNERAAELGLTCTRFASPSGLVDEGNHSCAADLAALARAVLDEPRLAAIVRRRSAILPMAIKGGRVHLFNHNPLLRAGYPGTLGVKTGFTRRAGRCLVAVSRRRGRRLGVVLLRSHDPGRQARQLLDRGFRAIQPNAPSAP